MKLQDRHIRASPTHADYGRLQVVVFGLSTSGAGSKDVGRREAGHCQAQKITTVGLKVGHAGVPWAGESGGGVSNASV
jgi:hypothetical protein